MTIRALTIFKSPQSQACKNSIPKGEWAQTFRPSVQQGIGEVLVRRSCQGRAIICPCLGRTFRSLVLLIVVIIQCCFSQLARGTYWTADRSIAREAVAELFTNLLGSIQIDEASPMRQKNPAIYADELIANFEREAQTLEITNRYKAAIAYGYKGRYDRSKEILTNLMKAQPENQTFPDMLGFICDSQGDYDQAALAYEKAWKNGSKESLISLAFARLRMDSPEKVTPLVQQLRASIVRHEEARDALLAYVLDTNDHEAGLFTNVIDGFTDEDALKKPPNALPLYVLGFWKYGAKERALRIAAVANIPNGYNILTHDPVVRREIVALYEKQPETFAPIELKLVAKCYVLLPKRQLDAAIKLYKEYLIAKPKDGAAWGELGGVNMLMGNESAAIQACNTGWKLGDTQSLKILAILYFNGNKPEKFKQLIPFLFEHKNEDIDIVQSLVAYSMSVTPKDKELFERAINNVGNERILLSSEDGINVFISGFRTFGYQSRAEELESKAAKRKRVI